MPQERRSSSKASTVWKKLKHQHAVWGKTHLGHLIRRVLLRAGLTSSHHVGLEKGALQEDMVVIESLVHKGQHCLSHLLCTVQVMFTIRKNLSGTDTSVKILSDGKIKQCYLQHTTHTIFYFLGSNTKLCPKGGTIWEYHLPWYLLVDITLWKVEELALMNRK